MGERPAFLSLAGLALTEGEGEARRETGRLGRVQHVTVTMCERQLS